MNKKTRIILIVLAVIFFGIAIKELHTEFPDLQMPLINKYLGDEKPSINGSPYKTYYYELSNVEKQAYNLVLESIYDLPEKILVPDLTSGELDEVFKALLNDNPDLFFLGRKCSLKAELWNDFISFEYIMTKEEYDRKNSELKLKRDMVISQLTDKNDQWQTELEIHDYIVSHCSYKLEDNDFNYSSAYGCLVNGKAACEGYSKAAKYIFDKVGIESALISGTAQGNGEKPGEHMWNIVKINNDYYHLDCTWDDPVSNSKDGVKLYTYFNLSDEAIGINHFQFSYDPGCDSMDENYYVKKNLCFENYSKADENRLREVLLKEYNSGEKFIQINFVTKKSYDNAHADLVENKKIVSLLNNVRSNLGTTLSRRFVGYYENAELYTLTFLFK